MGSSARQELSWPRRSESRRLKVTSSTRRASVTHRSLLAQPKRRSKPVARLRFKKMKRLPRRTDLLEKSLCSALMNEKAAAALKRVADERCVADLRFALQHARASGVDTPRSRYAENLPQSVVSKVRACKMFRRAVKHRRVTGLRKALSVAEDFAIEPSACGASQGTE